MKVSELFSDPSRWTKHSAARNVLDDPVDPFDATACKWCLIGAIVYCYGKCWTHYPILEVMYKILGGRSISRWQDREETTYADVIALVKKAEAIHV